MDLWIGCTHDGIFFAYPRDWTYNTNGFFCYAQQSYYSLGKTIISSIPMCYTDCHNVNIHPKKITYVNE
jgi:hypothetical protein